MAEVDLEPQVIAGRSGQLSLIATMVVCFLFGIVAGVASYLAAGASLGLLFGPVLLATLFTPPLVLARSLSGGILEWLAIVVGVCAVWILTGGLLVREWAACTLVLAAYLLALAGVAILLARWRVSPVLASAITVVLGLAWLTWPIWLIRALSGSGGEKLVGWLAAAHPLLAINGVVLNRFDEWDRYRLAYQQLTTLNQDVFYHLPRSVIPAIALHGIIGVVCWTLVALRGRRFHGGKSHER